MNLHVYLMDFQKEIGASCWEQADSEHFLQLLPELFHIHLFYINILVKI